MVRILHESDAAALWELRRQGLVADPLAFAETAEEHARVPVAEYAERLRQTTGDRFVLGAFEGEQLVGMVGLRRAAIARARHRATVWGFYVDAAFRRRGHARALMQELISRARQQPGLEQLTLAVAVGTDAARALYLSFGFVIYGLQPRALRLADQYVDDELMVLHLHS
jgi:ribosomal protein S18 acetylase RimI-like enzyme